MPCATASHGRLGSASKRLEARERKAERKAAKKVRRALKRGGPAMLAPAVESGAFLERINAARARMAEAELAIAAWKAQRDQDELEMMTWLV